MGLRNQWERLADDNDDQDWLNWLRSANDRAEIIEYERNFIDNAKRSELTFRLGNFMCKQSDEIYIGDITMDQMHQNERSYSDDQLVEDGLLVPIANLNILAFGRIVDRITIQLWTELISGIPKDSFGSIAQPALETVILSILHGMSGAEPEISNERFKCKLNERNRWTLCHNR